MSSRSMLSILMMMQISFVCMGADSYAQARKHMKPELAACKNKLCVKNLLYKDEEVALDKFFDEYNIPQEKRKKFNAEFADLATYNPLFPNDYYPNPDKQFHDEEGLGKELVNVTKHILKEYGINPYAVRISSDDKFFQKNSKAGAVVDYFGYPNSASIRYDVKGINGTPFTWKHLKSIMHEVIHLKESHGIKRGLARNLIPWHAKIFCSYNMAADEEKSAPASFCALNRTQEMQADLFPLLDFGGIGVFDNFVNHYIKECNDIDIPVNKWHTSSPFKTHPECTELLPYIVKIKDLEKQGAKSLIRRLDPSDLNLFEKD